VLQSYGGNTSAFLKVNGKLSAISKFIAGNYTIELTRRKNMQWSTDDFKYDNDNFVICLSNILRPDKLSIFNEVLFSPPNTTFGFPASIMATLTYGILPGDTITVTNSTYNNGTYTVIQVMPVTPGSPLIIFRVSPDIHNGHIIQVEASRTAVITFANSLFIETACSVLQQPVQNVINAPLSQGWLNMSITPARMLQAQINRITAGLQIIQGKIQFLGGSGNFQAGTQMFNTGQQQDYTGNILYENTSLNFNDLNVRNITPLWLPEIYRFEYPITYQQFKQIKSNPNGFITFYKFSNDVKFGFLLSMDYEIKTGMTKFELLRMNPPEAIEGVLNEDGTYIII
jgi:hypothetical protein